MATPVQASSAFLRPLLTALVISDIITLPEDHVQPAFAHTIVSIRLANLDVRMANVCPKISAATAQFTETARLQSHFTAITAALLKNAPSAAALQANAPPTESAMKTIRPFWTS
jgi:hypothetical protein